MFDRITGYQRQSEIAETENGIWAQNIPISTTFQTPQVTAFRNDDVYIKSCCLKKDGSNMVSLCEIPATRKADHGSYCQFASVVGAVNTGKVDIEKVACKQNIE